MRAAIAGADALRIWRDARFSSAAPSNGQPLPGDMRSSINMAELAFLAKRFGLVPPIYCSSPQPNSRNHSWCYDCHVLPSSLADALYLPFGVESLISTPELSLLQTAGQLARKNPPADAAHSLINKNFFESREMKLAAPDILLAALATEFASNYAIDQTKADGFSPRPPILAPEGMRALLNVKYVKGIAAFRFAYAHIQGNANSPEESSLALLMALPRALGGMGQTGLQLNYPLTTKRQGRPQKRYIDICIPEKKLAIEMNSKRYHEGERANKDEERRSEITALGYKLCAITPEMLFNAEWLEENLSAFLGNRKERIPQDYAQRRSELRALIFEANNTNCRENTRSILGEKLRL